MFGKLALAPFISQKIRGFLAKLNQTDLVLISELMQSGKVTPAIDRRYKLTDVPDAIRYLEEGHARGKVVIIVDH
jgi:NADPH:quinone reductase-like Zn-dependent oxidoreductase